MDMQIQLRSKNHTYCLVNNITRARRVTSVESALAPDYTLLIWEPVCIAGDMVQAITWEKWDDALLWVFLPSLDWELVKYLHLMREKGCFTMSVCYYYCLILDAME